MICIALAESDKSSSSSSSTSHYDEDNDDERSNTNSTVSDSAASETYDAYEVYYSSSVAPNIVSHNEIHSPHQPSVAEAKSVVERMGWNVHGGDVVIRSIEFKHRGCHYASKGQKPFNAV